MSTEPKKRGMKAGATVPDRPMVDWQPPHCPHCQAVTDPTNLRYKREIVGSGTFNGRPYGKVTLWSANCGACGAALTVRQHEFIPEHPTA